MRILSPALALLLLASAASAQTGKQLVSSFVKNLYGAKALTASFTVQDIGGSPTNYNIQLSKPNLARIETDDETIIADGNDIYTYFKADKTYFKQQETADSLSAVFQDQAFSLWQGFFDKNALSGLPDAVNVGSKVRGGMQLTQVDVAMDWAGQERETFYFDKSDLAKQAEIKLQNPVKTTLVLVETVTLSDAPIGDSSSKTFAFSGPSDAREVSLDNMFDGHWYDHLSDALHIAKLSHRLVLLEFVEKNSAYCQRMQTEIFDQQDFKDMNKSYVFCRIDVAVQPDLVSKFQVKGAPDVRLFNSSGQQLTDILGYMNKTQFMAILQRTLTANPPV